MEIKPIRPTNLFLMRPDNLGEVVALQNVARHLQYDTAGRFRRFGYSVLEAQLDALPFMGGAITTGRQLGEIALCFDKLNPALRHPKVSDALSPYRPDNPG